jgi:N-acyl homoserine lactone hydrolase
MRLHLLTLGEIRGLGAPIPGYVIVAGDGSVVLVDTGPVRALPPGTRLPMIPGEPVEKQLAALDIKPRDVRYVVCTHLDPDHSGGHDQFPDAEFVIQRDHLAAARAGRIDRLLLTRPQWDGLRFKPVQGHTELLPGLELIDSPGHVPGHQSVLVRLPVTGPVLLAADAIPMALCQDPATRDSTRRLMELAGAEKALVVYGHDPVQWPSLVAAGGQFT